MKTRLVALLMSLLAVVSTSSCGTLLFAERQNEEHSGKLDPNVLIMDGFGLLLFIVPGVVAFGIDFHTGAIYLPKGVVRGEGPFISDRSRSAD